MQALNFAHTLLGCKGWKLSDISSPRVRGSVRAMYETKNPLRQAPPLTVTMVETLEHAACDHPDEYIRLVAGHLCFCLYSSCRVADARYINRVEVSEARGIVLVETDTQTHKTATSKEKKTRFLPLLALGRGLINNSWARSWSAARQHMIIDSEFNIPARSEIDGSLLDRNLTTGECTCLLREILTEAGCPAEEAKEVSSHSLKATILAWASKSARVSFEDRRLIGHHTDRNTISPLTYSRDECTRLMAVVHGLLQLIRTGVLDPDAPRVERLASLALDTQLESASMDPSPRPLPDSDVDEEDLGHCLGVNLGPRPLEATVPPEELLEICKQHIHSRVVHVLSEGSKSKFKCGRVLNQNYSDIGPYEILEELALCMQCTSSASYINYPASA